MYTRLAVAAALLSAVNAVPVAQSGTATSSAAPAPTTSGPPAIATPAAPLKSGTPFQFPLPNGFNGTLNATELNNTNIQAQGTQPNGAAPVPLTEDDLLSFQMIAFNEIFEVAYFTDLLYNVTNNVTGYVVTDQGIGVKALQAIQAQEEIHADNANNVLIANGQPPIQPCEYHFLVDNLNEALGHAKLFTDVVLGTLQDIQMRLAQNGASALVPIIGSVIGQEGEQTGFFRQSGGLIPSSQPFLTRATREFAYSALNQLFVVPGSCPPSNNINLPIFDMLVPLNKTVYAEDQTLTFLVGTNGTAALEGTSFVWINSQNTPVVTNWTNARVAGGMTLVDVDFPYTEYLMNGLSIGAITNSSGPFASAEDVAKVTLAGPGLIDVLQ